MGDEQRNGGDDPIGRGHHGPDLRPAAGSAA
jgi:hypothetical protein